MSLQDYLIEKPILETKNLVLRRLGIEDVDDLNEWLSNPEIYQYWGKRPSKSDLDARLMFKDSKPKPTKSFYWGIVHKANNKVIGELWVYKIENNRMAKVSYRLSDDYKGKELMTEALKAVVKFCLENTELKRLWTDVDIRNIPSYKVLEKCGFIREGLVRQGKMVSTYCDYYLYGILKEDFIIE